MTFLELIRTPIYLSIKRGAFPILSRCYATTQPPSTAPSIAGLGKKKGMGKVGPSLEKKTLPVETDATKLVNYVCGTNLLKEGGEDVKVKEDSEYPDWLWELNLGDPPPLEEIEPDTFYYWYRYRKLAMRANNQLLKATRRIK